jgi:hypothetical protein
MPSAVPVTCVGDSKGYDRLEQKVQEEGGGILEKNIGGMASLECRRNTSSLERQLKERGSKKQRELTVWGPQRL